MESSQSFDPGVFDQRDVWVDERGRVFRLVDLDAGQRRQLVAWLRRHVRLLYVQQLQHELGRWVLDRVEPTSSTRTMPSLTLTSGLEGRVEALPEVVFVSAEDWLASTELVRALRRETAGESSGTESG